MVDCSSITDAELDTQIFSVWQHPQEVVYSFNAVLADEELARFRYTGHFPWNYASEAYQAAARHVMQYWESISNGLLRFTEVNFLDNQTRGIYFSTCGELAEFEQEDLQGFMRWWPKLGYLHRTVICLPNGVLEETNDHWLYVLFHEVGHALGLNHLHETASMKEKLRQMRYGALCSVMPYPHEIMTNRSICPPSMCHSLHTIYPGPLDRRSLQLAYQNPRPRFNDFLALPGPEAEPELDPVVEVESVVIDEPDSPNVVEATPLGAYLRVGMGLFAATAIQSGVIAALGDTKAVNVMADLGCLMMLVCAGVITNTEQMVLASSFLLLRVLAHVFNDCSQLKHSWRQGLSVVRHSNAWTVFNALLAVSQDAPAGWQGQGLLLIYYLGAGFSGRWFSQDVAHTVGVLKKKTVAFRQQSSGKHGGTYMAVGFN